MPKIRLPLGVLLVALLIGGRNGDPQGATLFYVLAVLLFLWFISLRRFFATPTAGLLRLCLTIVGLYGAVVLCTVFSLRCGKREIEKIYHPKERIFDLLFSPFRNRASIHPGSQKRRSHNWFISPS